MNILMTTNLIIQVKWTNFLKKHNLLKLTQETDNLNKSISIKEMESIISNLPKQKAPGPAGVQTLKEFYIILTILHK